MNMQKINKCNRLLDVQSRFLVFFSDLVYNLSIKRGIITSLKLSRSCFYGVFSFLLLLFSGFLILGCDLFSNSMTDYFLDNTGVVEVRGIVKKSEYVVMTNGTILIPPGSDEPVSILEASLSNPRDLSVRYKLLGVPPGKNITIRPAGSTTMELVIKGAGLNDEFDLTLVMQSSDGLRDFAGYNIRIQCVSFNTALSDFRVNDIHPFLHQDSFRVELPYETKEVTLEGFALEETANLALFRIENNIAASITSGTGQVEAASPLYPGDNFFYLEVSVGGAAQWYIINVIQMQDPNKEPGITISGITVEGLNILNFSVVSMPVKASAPITIMIGGIVADPNNDWYIDINGKVSPRSSTPNRVIFNAPAVPGFYNINVIATINNIPYSGSFGLIVE
jgi:hypothetical protein